ncbi:MAG: hypothetical protein JSS07_09545 [Proteobacteria bacterium]|nr:hypothetical protein [Pseudomonadota bacterium]
MLLIHDGRSVVQCCDNKKMEALNGKKRKKIIVHNKTAVEVANKNARIAWALLARNEKYKKAA